MVHSLLKAGALALGSLTVAAPALAVTSLPLNSAVPLVVLAQDLENQEVWQDLRPGPTYDIYAQRLNSSGVVQWAATGAAVCTVLRSSGERSSA